jgi:hypothetical protein
MSSRLARSSAVLAALFAGAVSVPSGLRAQESAVIEQTIPAVEASPAATVAPAATSDAVPAAGPRVSRAGIDRPVAANPLGVPEPQEGAHVGAGTNLALIGVGVAGVIVGLVIGGDGGTVVAAGSAVVGLIGLYRWLK